ncbi:MAG: VOC family protein [Acidobacteriota bacterium]|nr:VOC family protein [Acidobacteriota bacterium]
MLTSKNAVATIAVKSVNAARTFYGDVLGLTIEETPEKGVIGLKSGATSLLVYESEFAGTNKATAATWIVGTDLDAIVSTLKERGVTFEHYDFPGTTRKGDIHEAGNMRVAWLKDPDGNILSLVNG